MNDKEKITAKDQTQTKYAYGRREKNRKGVLWVDPHWWKIDYNGCEDDKHVWTPYIFVR